MAASHAKSCAPPASFSFHIYQYRFESTTVPCLKLLLDFNVWLSICLLKQASNNHGEVCEVRSAIWTFVLPKYQLMCQLVSTCKSVTTFSIVPATTPRSKHDNYLILWNTLCSEHRVTEINLNTQDCSQQTTKANVLHTMPVKTTFDRYPPATYFFLTQAYLGCDLEGRLNWCDSGWWLSNL